MLSSTRMAVAAPVKPGDVLGGKYRVERILGAGGMGVVVAARHLELGQRVALKFMLKEAMSDPAHAERFLREARASVQLKSVHTARVLDVGKLSNGEPYMVMEYLDGKDLDEVLRLHGPLPPHVACDYVLQASEALAEAHGLGMIHRDVKLKNIFLTTTVDGRPLVKVLDFGLAKQTGIGGDVSLTATSSVFGSPQYMSPEQMRSAKDVDSRSDIWSLGVCLYELLTGRVPFDAAGVAEICAMVLKDPVPPPSRFVRGLPGDLEAVILRCLEKDARRRFQTVADLAFALESYAAEEGSARRILQVMQTAQKTEVPTIVTADPPPDDGHARTMAAFSTGARTQRTSRPPVVLVTVIAMGLALIGLALTFVAVRNRPDAKAATAVATATVTTAVSAAVPEPPLAPSADPAIVPGSTGTVLGATEPAGTATAAQPAQHPRPGGTSRPPVPKPTAVKTVSTAAAPPPKPTAPPPAPKPTRSDPGDRL